MHARPEALARIEGLLAELRKRPITEKKPGIFYLKSSAFLHFHEEGEGIYAHLKVGKTFERFDVNTKLAQRTLLEQVDQALRSNAHGSRNR